MKVSLNWIREYVQLPKDIELSKLAYDLTMSTVEVEDVVELSEQFEGMMIGVVKEILPHPDADALVICMTDVGDGELKQIVCGGSNLYENIKVAIAPPGTKVRWHGEGDLIELKKAKIRGVESFGMICASSEIGLFDLFPFEEESTIVDLSDFEAEAGTPLAVALGLDDVILEIDNKSLTNRPDLWGHYGIARELAALYDLPLKEIPLYEPPKALPSDGFDVIIDDTERCHRYVGVRMEGLPVKAASYEVQSRLWRVGSRPINAIVDITNYVMLATGEPTHAFDADVIAGNIHVRRAKEKEKLLLLKGMEVSLTTEDLVIADEKEAVALAGVMGGEKDSIHDNTKRVILEVANFDALSVRRSSVRHEIRTDSATRFEKGVDPDRVDIALSLAMQMFTEMYPDMQIISYVDNYHQKLNRKEIDVSLDWLAARLGQKLPLEYLENKLGRLGFDVSFVGTEAYVAGDVVSAASDSNSADSGKMHVIAPTWRSTGDISIPEDIVEEVARMYGLENFVPTPIVTTIENSINQPEIDLDRKIREYLAFRCGMNEVYTYPWVSDDFLNALYPEINQAEMCELSAPPSPNEKYLRQSLLPNLCKAVSENLRYFNEFAIFESAQVFFNKDFSTAYDEKEALPLQKKHVAGAFVGNPDDLEMLFRKAKGALENLSRMTHSEPLYFEKFEASDRPAWADETVWLNITARTKSSIDNDAGSRDKVANSNTLSGGAESVKIGELALLSRKAALACGIKSASVVLFELDIDSLKPLPSRTNTFERISDFPTTTQDFSMLFDRATKWDDIWNTVVGKRGPDNLVQDVQFVEEYRGQQVPDDKKSITVRLIVGSNSKTLTSDEIEKCTNAVAKRLEKRLGAVLR